MPLTPGSNVSDTIRELHRGMTFKHTAQKFGRSDANRQAVAIALSNAGKGRAMGGVAGYDDGGAVQSVISALNQGSNASGGGMGPAATTTTTPGAASTNQVNSGLNGATGVAPAPAATMGPQAQNTAPAASAASPSGVAPATGIAQPTTPAPGTTTPNNPLSKPLMARGGALHRASGGFNMATGPNLNPSWEEKQESRNMMHTGPISSIVPGRTDNHHAFVPSGSYVLPSSHISSMGQGNTGAGLAMAHTMFGMPDMPIKHGSGAPRPPRSAGMLHTGGSYSEGGARGEVDDHKPVEVMLSGGEFVIAPQIVRRIGKGSLKNGHKILDAYVMAARKKEIRTQQNLPPPAKK